LHKRKPESDDGPKLLVEAWWSVDGPARKGWAVMALKIIG